MLFRKIESFIKNWLQSDNNKILVIDGARQIGKSYIIRKCGQELFENYIELNFVEDKQDKHNCLIERMVAVEQSTKSAHHRLDYIEEHKYYQ